MPNFYDDKINHTARGYFAIRSYCGERKYVKDINPMSWTKSKQYALLFEHFKDCLMVENSHDKCEIVTLNYDPSGVGDKVV